MIPIRRLLAPALVLSAVLAHGVRAQTPLPLALEVRGGVAIPTGDFDDGASTGWTLGASVRYTVRRDLDLYLGYEHGDFGVDDDADTEGVDVGIQDDGLRAGARANVGGMSAGTIRPWVEAGFIYNRASISGEDEGTSVTFHSGWRFGFEAGAGVSFDVSPRITLTPGVRYRQHDAPFDFQEVGDDTPRVSYVTVDLGVSFHP